MNLEEDREDDINIDPTATPYKPKLSGKAVEAIQDLPSPAMRPTLTDHQIVIAAQNEEEFSSVMEAQYPGKFKEGFRILKENQALLLEDDGDEKLGSMLKDLFSLKHTVEFMDKCTTWLIV
jgi:hypothetical protein